MEPNQEVIDENETYMILRGADPRLLRKCEDWNFDEVYTPPDDMMPQLLRVHDAISLANELRGAMCAARGIGLSAPQLGLPVRVIAVGNPQDPNSIIVAFNPKVVDTSAETVTYEEGCLSFPGLFLKVKRPVQIRVRYTTEKGVTDTIKFDGLTARVFQHEIDHLDGVLFTSRVSSFEMHRARNKQKQLLRKLKQMRKRQASMQIKKVKVVPTANAVPTQAEEALTPAS